MSRRQYPYRPAQSKPVSYPPHVRLGTPADEEDIMELCRELHEENGIFTLSEDKVREMLHKAFNREGGVIGIIGKKGALEGMIYLLMSNFWYSTDPHWEELFVFVRPAFRKTKGLDGNEKFSRMRELAEFAKWCSHETGFPLVIGVMSDERTEGKVRLYQRYFGTPIGNFFFFYKAPAVEASLETAH